MSDNRTLNEIIDDTAEEIQSLIMYSNEITGTSDTTLASAITSLCEGYGVGGEDNVIITKLVDTSTEDISFPDYIRRNPYEYTYDNCYIWFYAIGGDVPLQGNWTLNNFVAIIEDNVLKLNTHEYKGGKVSADTFKYSVGIREGSYLLLDNHKVTSNIVMSSTSSCICGVGGSIYAVEIPFKYGEIDNVVTPPISSGLIAWFDCGDESTISDDGFVTSKVDTDIVGWTAQYNNSYGTHNTKPTDYYHGLCNKAFKMYSEEPIISDEIKTIEYLYCCNYSNINYAFQFAKKTSMSQSVSPTLQQTYMGGCFINSTFFIHHVVMFDSTGFVKTYINGVPTSHKSTNQDVTGCNYFGIGGGYAGLDGYIGHVRIYDRELTAEEVRKNARWFTKNCYVGAIGFLDNTFVGNY